jgi:copper chaperone NosL
MPLSKKFQMGVLLLPFVMAVSCKISPKPIVYGTDGCHYCSMTIVDRQHAAQLVTKKGKTFKFDAIECMLNYMKEIDTGTVALYLCNYYSEPGEFISSEEATYLISDNIPSPMGEFLTAFDSEESANMAEEENGGVLYSWTELLNHMNN